MSKWEKVGVVAVDAGILMIGDPCYQIQSDSCEMPKTWKGFCEVIGDETIHQFNFKKGHHGAAVVIGGFGGDGVFDVEVKKNETGRITEMRVRF